MPSHTQSIGFVPTLRAAAIVTLCGATALATPFYTARAETPTAASPAMAHSHGTRHETVEQRIARLHASLRITADEETKWTSVAQVMRDNDSVMEKLAADAAATPADSLSAVDDLKAFQKFAQAHADGLGKLITSFDALYSAMPEAQKQIADQVFGKFSHAAARGHA